ncbi:glycogen synthase GlgA [Peptoniphilaceae bacterium SGI.097]
MNILYVAAEVAPFVKTGGLADVAGSLPKALVRLGQDCRICMPLFGQISDEYRMKMKKRTEFYVSVGWKNEYCGVWEMEHEGVTIYFLDNEFYFHRDSVYGQGDDAQRFIFFSKAAARLPRVLDWKVDVIHANDWHSALTPVYVNDFRRGDAFYENVRTVFTIHNLKYQGQFAPGEFYWTNLDPAYFSDFDLKFYDSINFMKGGIVHSTKVNTVSPTYAQEIHFPFFAEGLENVINAYTDKISGILNGIDYDVWNPETDPWISQNFSVSNLSVRKKNKLEVQKLAGLPTREDVPLFAMVSRLTAMKGLDLLRYIMEEFLQEDIQIVILGTGDAAYEEMFRYFHEKYPERCAALLYYSNPASHRIYAGCDVLLMPSVSEPCGLSQMIAMRYGAVPLVREAGGLRDSVKSYNRYEKTGDGFSFANINAHDLLYTMRMAADVYRNHSDDFQMLQHNGMTKDLSWNVSSKDYIQLYESLFS